MNIMSVKKSVRFFRRHLLVLFLLGLNPFLAQSQTNQLATAFLASLREPTYEVSNKFLSYSKLVLLEGLTKKAVRDKASILNEVIKGRITIQETPPFNGQERLKGMYMAYFLAMEVYLNRLPIVEIESVEFFNADSAHKYQEIQIVQLEILLKESAKLKQEVEKFCLLNKVIGVKTSGALFANQQEAITLISYAVRVKNAVMAGRRLNRLFLTSLLEDTGHKAETVRLALIAATAKGKADLLAIPNFPGERTLKITGLNNLRLKGISAAKVYKQLINFRSKELAFIQMSIDYKQKRSNEKEADAYYKEVERFSALIKTNRRQVKALNTVRRGLEETFNKNFFNFVGDRFVLRSDGEKFIAYKK